MTDKTVRGEPFSETLRQAARTHNAAQIDLQSLVFQQGRDIARAYADMMKSYAQLTVRSGNYVPDGDRLTVTGFCRVESVHFGKEPLFTEEKTHQGSIWTARLSELGQRITRRITLRSSDLFAAFCTSFAEFCAAEGIRTGAVSVLVRKKDGSTEYRPLPAEIAANEQAECIGYVYEITF